MNNPVRILLVEDDLNLLYLVKQTLEENGYRVTGCKDGNDAWKEYTTGTFDMCILDVMLPKLDGFSLAEKIRKADNHTFIIFLTAKKLNADIYKGFEIGADDYITKPFTSKELLLRINAFIKRAKASHQNGGTNDTYNIGECTFNYPLKNIQHKDDTLPLTTKESELLKMFCEHKNEIVRREQLMMAVWGNDSLFISKRLDVYINKLRKKLNIDKTLIIQNHHGLGYLLMEYK